jgi:abortive infection bacteriophage resistance protein
MFDRQLRRLVMDAIERIEVAVRCALTDELAIRFGPFPYLDPSYFPEAGRGRHSEFVDEVRENADLPIWAVAETMSFGTMFSLIKMSRKQIQQAVASRFRLPAVVLSSWLHTLNYVRNLCAHHSRLWNRQLSIKPLLPTHDPLWHGTNAVPNDRLFVVLTQLYWMMKVVAPRSEWRNRLFANVRSF